MRNSPLLVIVISVNSIRYVLFSIGNIKPLFSAAFKSCWGTASKTNQLICNPQWINAVDYLEIVGIIVGQILVGILGDWYV